MSAFTETDLLLAVIARWGNAGAHADLLRGIMRRAGIDPDALVEIWDCPLTPFAAGAGPADRPAPPPRRTPAEVDPFADPEMRAEIVEAVANAAAMTIEGCPLGTLEAFELGHVAGAHRRWAKRVIDGGDRPAPQITDEMVDRAAEVLAGDEGWSWKGGDLTNAERDQYRIVARAALRAALGDPRPAAGVVAGARVRIGDGSLVGVVAGARVRIGDGSLVGVVVPPDSVEVRWPEGDTTTVAASDLRFVDAPPPARDEVVQLRDRLEAKAAEWAEAPASSVGTVERTARVEAYRDAAQMADLAAMALGDPRPTEGGR